MEYDNSKIVFFKVCVILDDTILRLSSCESILLFCELDISKKNFPKLSKSDGKLWYGLVSFLFEDANIFLIIIVLIVIIVYIIITNSKVALLVAKSQASYSHHH